MVVPSLEDALRVEGRKKRRRPILRLEDCAKRDLGGGERSGALERVMYGVETVCADGS